MSIHHRHTWQCLTNIISDRIALEYYHSDLAWRASSGKRWPSNLRTATASEVLLSANLKHLDRISPTAGPPNTQSGPVRNNNRRSRRIEFEKYDWNYVPRTRTISAVLPPSSETGRTCATRVVKFLSSSTTPLKAVPPEKTSREGRAGLGMRVEEEEQRQLLGFWERRVDMEWDLLQGNWGRLRVRHREEGEGEGPNQLSAIFPRLSLPPLLFSVGTHPSFHSPLFFNFLG